MCMCMIVFYRNARVKREFCGEKMWRSFSHFISEIVCSLYYNIPAYLQFILLWFCDKIFGNLFIYFFVFLKTIGAWGIYVYKIC